MSKEIMTPQQKIDSALAFYKYRNYEGVFKSFLNIGNFFINRDFAVDDSKFADFSRREKTIAFKLLIDSMISLEKTNNLAKLYYWLYRETGTFSNEEIEIARNCIKCHYSLESAKLYPSLIHSKPQNEIILYFAQHLFENKRLDEAKKWFRLILEKNFMVFESRRYLSIIHAKLKEIPEAICELSYLEKAGQMTKDDEERYEKCLTSFNSSQTINLSSIQKTSDLELLIDSMTRSSKTNNLAKVYYYLYEKSKTFSDKEIKIAEDCVNCYYSAESIRLYESLIQSKPLEYGINYYFAQHFFVHKEFEFAKKYFRISIEKGFNIFESRRFLSQIHFTLKEFNESLCELSHLKKAKQMTEDDIERYEKCLESLMPEHLKEGRGGGVWNRIKRTGIYMINIGENIGSTLSGRSTRILNDKSVINSVPQLLRPENINQTLNTQSANQSWQTFFGKHKIKMIDAMVAGGDLTAEYLYYVSCFDMNVLNAITFSDSSSPNTYNEFLHSTRWFTETTGESLDGYLNRLEGYVAEQKVAFDLTASGHHVEFPDHPNNIGWDMLVDGQPYQIKNSLNPELVTEHLKNHPDIPVFINTDIADHFSDNHMVHVDPDLSYYQIHDTTVHNLDNMQNAHHIGLPLPVITIGVSLLRHRKYFCQNIINCKQYIQRVGIDTVFRGLSGFGGAKLGAALGGIVFGPFGALAIAIPTGIIMTVIGGTFADKINLKSVCDARDKVIKELGIFARWLVNDPLRSKVAMIKKRKIDFSEWAYNARIQGFAPEVVTCFENISEEDYRRALALSQWLEERLKNGDEYDLAYAGWVSLRESPYIANAKLPQKIESLRKALERYSQEKCVKH